MSRNKVSIHDVLKSRESETILSANDFDVINTEEEEAIDVDLKDAETDIEVDLTGVEAAPIELAVISDEHGRISDLIEALEETTGQSVIPFEMGHISPEVMTLARHKIFEFAGGRFAMSHRKRMGVIESFQERIIKTLSSGIPFREELNTVVTYNDTEYKTFKLSEDEWKYLMAKFRNYKERLFVTSDNKLVIEILAERK